MATSSEAGVALPAVAETDQSEAARDAYNAVVAAAGLQAVQLQSMSFRVEPEFFGDKTHRRLNVDIEHERNEFDANQGLAFAFVNIVVTAKRARKNTLACKAGYLVVYDNLKGCRPDAARLFLDRVAPFACYPYFRSLFATLDWAAGTSLPPLPVHKEKSRVEKAGAPF